MQLGGLAFFQMIATLGSYSGTPQDFMTTTGFGTTFDLGFGLVFYQTGPWATRGQLFYTWYGSSFGYQLYFAFRAIPESQPPAVAGFMLAAPSADISSNHLAAIENVLATVRPYEAPPAPGGGELSKWALKLAGSAFQRTSSDFSGASTRVQYWFCSDGSFRQTIQRYGGGSSFTSRDAGTYQATKRQLKLFSAGGGEAQFINLSFDDSSGSVSFGGEEYITIQNSECS